MLHFTQDESSNSARVVRMTPWRRQIVETDAGEIETLDIGAGQNRAILLLTHGLGSVHSLEEIAEGINARFSGTPHRRLFAARSRREPRASRRSLHEHSVV